MRIAKCLLPNLDCELDLTWRLVSNGESMQTYVIRLHNTPRGRRMSVPPAVTEEFLRSVIRADVVEIACFQPFARRYPMILVCRADNKGPIDRMVRGLEVVGHLRAEVSLLP